MKRRYILSRFTMTAAFIGLLASVTGAQPGSAPVLIPYTPDPEYNLKPVLMWDSVAGATKYKIQIDTSVSFTSPYLSDSTAGILYYQPTAPLVYDSIYWRVFAGNAVGWGPASAPDAFLVLNDNIARWDGGGADSNWSNALNWMYDVVPMSTDSVVFDSTSKGCKLDISDTVRAIKFSSGYTGDFYFQGRLLAMTTTADFRSGGKMRYLGNDTLILSSSSDQDFYPHATDTLPTIMKTGVKRVYLNGNLRTRGLVIRNGKFLFNSGNHFLMRGIRGDTLALNDSCDYGASAITMAAGADLFSLVNNNSAGASIYFEGNGSDTLRPGYEQFGNMIINRSGGLLWLTKGLYTDTLKFNGTAANTINLGINLLHSVNAITSMNNFTAVQFGTCTLEVMMGADFSGTASISAGSGLIRFYPNSNTYDFKPKAGYTFPDIVLNGSLGTVNVTGQSLTVNNIRIYDGWFQWSNGPSVNNVHSIINDSIPGIATDPGMDFYSGKIRVDSTVDLSLSRYFSTSACTLDLCKASGVQYLYSDTTVPNNDTLPVVVHSGTAALTIGSPYNFLRAFKQTSGVLNLSSVNGNSTTIEATNGDFVIEGDSTSILVDSTRWATIKVAGNALLKGKPYSYLRLDFPTSWWLDVMGTRTAHYVKLNNNCSYSSGVALGMAYYAIGSSVMWTVKNYKVWSGAAGTPFWSNSGNWQPATLPDSTDSIVFETGSASCMLDMSDTVKAIIFTPGYTGSFDFSSNRLTVRRDADFGSIGTMYCNSGTLAFDSGGGVRKFTPKSGGYYNKIIKGRPAVTCSVLVVSNPFTVAILDLGSSYGTWDWGSEGLSFTVGNIVNTTMPSAIVDFGNSTVRVNGDSVNLGCQVISEAGALLEFYKAADTQYVYTISALPGILHSGAGLLRLRSDINCPSFTQTSGTLDLSSQTITTAGDFNVTKGTTPSFANLDGKTITIGGKAHLKGFPGDSIDLSVASMYTIYVTDSLLAEYAIIGNSNAGNHYGEAYFSRDALGNFNWRFPDITAPVNDLTLSLYPLDTTRIVASWTSAGNLYASDVDSVSIWWSTVRYPDSVYDPISSGYHQIGKSVTLDTISGLVKGTVYYFCLSMRDTAGNWASFTVSSQKTDSTAAYIGPVWHVKADAAPGGIGSAASPFDSLYKAFQKAKKHDTVKVASGSYYVNSDLSFIYDSITVLGSYDASFGSRAVQQAGSIIDGGNSSYRLRINRYGCTVDGFTFKGFASMVIEILNGMNEKIENNRFIGNSTAMIVSQSWNTVIRNNLFVKSDRALFLDRNTSAVKVINNTFTRNALTIHNSYSADSVVNNIFAFNQYVDYDSGTVSDTFLYNAFWQNDSILMTASGSLYGINGINAMPGCAWNAELNPAFVDTSLAVCNYKLQNYSQCIDAGHPSYPYDQEPSPNGSRIDNGVYGNTPWATSRDNTPPSGCSIAIIDVNGYTKDLHPALTLGASGADSMRTALTYDTSSAVWKQYASLDSVTFTIGGLGKKQIWVQFKDLAGNLTAWYGDSTVFDTLQPTAAIVVPADGMVANSIVSFNGTASDLYSGISKIEIKLKSKTDNTIWNGSTWGATNAWLPANGAINWTYTPPSFSQASYVVSARATDSAGNVQSVPDSAEFTIITTGPTVTVNQTAGQRDPVNSLPILFDVLFSDSVTGFTSGDVIFGGTATGIVHTITGQGKIYRLTVNAITTEGTIIPRIASGVAQDSLGNTNIASTSADNTVNYDTTVPSAPIITISDNNGYTRDIHPPFTISTSADSIRYALAADTAAAQWKMITSMDSISLGSEGMSVVWAQARDMAGNRSPWVFDSTVVDWTAPNGTFAVTDTMTAVSWSGNLQGSVTDNISGIDSILITIQEGITGKYWDGSAWIASQAATLKRNTASWSIPLATVNLRSSAYYLRMQISDFAGNHCTVIDTFIFKSTVQDTVAPLPLPAFTGNALNASQAAFSWQASASTDADSIRICASFAQLPQTPQQGDYRLTLGKVTAGTLGGLPKAGGNLFVSSFVKDAAGNWSAYSAQAGTTVQMPDSVAPVNNIGISSRSAGDSSISVSFVTGADKTYDARWIKVGFNAGSRVTDMTGAVTVPCKDTVLVKDGAKIPGWWFIGVAIVDSSGNPSSMVHDSVQIANSAPVMSRPADTAISEDSPWSIALHGSDLNGDRVLFQLIKAPSGMVVDTTGLLSWTPDNAAVGKWVVAVSCSDSRGAKDVDSFTVTVINVNDPPVLSYSGDTTLLEDSVYNLRLSIIDPDSGDSASVRAARLPGWITLSTAGMTASPRNADVGQDSVILIVTDKAGLFDTLSIRFRVKNVNDVPVMKECAVVDSLSENGIFKGSFVFADVDAVDSLKLQWLLKPSWMVQGSSVHADTLWTWAIEGIPLDKDKGWNRFRISITDRSGATVEVYDSVYVVDVNNAPSLTVSKRINGGSAEFIMTGRDDRDTSLTFVVTLAVSGDTTPMFSFVTTETRVAFFPLSDGIYVFKGNIRDSEGLSGLAPCIDTFTITGASRHTFIDSMSWNMVGVPAKSIDAALVKGGGSISHWDESGQQRSIYSYYQLSSDITAVTAGKGYWRKAANPGQVEIHAGNLVDSNVVLHLSRGKYGWNQIACPYIYPVKWPGKEPLWKWNTSTRDFEQADSVLEPWAGYWVQVDSSYSVTLSNTPARPVTGFAKREMSYFTAKTDWSAQLILSSASGTDASNTFGFSKSAQDGVRTAEPPRMDGYLYFTDSKNAALASDIRGKWRGISIFQIGIVPDLSGNVQYLNARGIARLAPFVYVFMADRASLTMMREDSSYAIAGNGSTLYRTLFVTDNKSLGANIPVKFSFGKPFPNPCGPVVKVSYTLPYRWASNGLLVEKPYRVVLRIYDAKGRVLKELVCRNQQPGTYTVVWRGIGTTGRRVASGSYLCRLEAQPFMATERILMLK